MCSYVYFVCMCVCVYACETAVYSCGYSIDLLVERSLVQFSFAAVVSFRKELCTHIAPVDLCISVLIR